MSAQLVQVRGQVYHSSDPNFNLLIVNQSTSTGVFGNADGSFAVSANKNDVILVGALGYETVKISMADSADKPQYFVKVYLKHLSYNLNEVSIFPQRELDSIQADIRALGYDERDYMLSGINAMQSPLTFLYQQVSRKERMLRRAYEIINEDRRRALLKELFAKYVSFSIIDLEQHRFDEFVDFLNVSDQQLQSMTQYEFIQFTKSRYAIFEQLPERVVPEIDTHD